jgi:hypothetical protein
MCLRALTASEWLSRALVASIAVATASCDALRPAPRGQVVVVVDTDAGVSNATIGVQINNTPEVIVPCPITPPGDDWSACAPATL